MKGRAFYGPHKQPQLPAYTSPQLIPGVIGLVWKQEVLKLAAAGSVDCSHVKKPLDVPSHWHVASLHFDLANFITRALPLDVTVFYRCL